MAALGLMILLAQMLTLEIGYWFGRANRGAAKEARLASRWVYTAMLTPIFESPCMLSAAACRGGQQPRLLQVQDLRWVQRSELAGYPMGKIDRQIATRLLEQGA